MKRDDNQGHGAPLAAWDALAPAEGDRFAVDELLTRPAPAPMLVRPLVPRRTVTVLVGVGGVGKGQLLAMLAVAVATGGDFLGMDTEGGNVAWLSAEDERIAILRALHPLALGLSDPRRQALASALAFKALVGENVKLTRRVASEAIVAGDVEAMIAWARDYSPSLVLLDTLSRLNGLDESNEALALNVQAAERMAVTLDAAVVLTHHVGKGAHRAALNDQYLGRGGSAVSDNARSVLTLARVAADDPDAPTNGGALIAEGRLLRLSHVKSNYAAAAPDFYLERVVGPAGPWLRPWHAEWDAAAATASAWARLRGWLASTDLNFPTASAVDGLPARDFGSRAERRAALAWALDQGLVVELPHPAPRGRLRTYLALPTGSGPA